MVVVVAYIRWRKGVKLPRLKMSPTILRLISTSPEDVRLDRYFKERGAFMSEGTITHDALWTLFLPGTLILGHVMMSHGPQSILRRVLPRVCVGRYRL